MLRAAATVLFVVSVASGAVMAQRGGGASHGSASAARSGASSGRGVRGSFTDGRFRRDHFHRNRTNGVLYPYLFPYDEPYGYEEPYAESAPQQPAPAQAQAPQPPAEPKLIEVPGAEKAAAAKPLPPAIFILTSGERLETSRFLLRANDLSVTVNRQQRTIPLTQVDLDATLAANHSRGIELEIPADPNEISLRF